MESELPGIIRVTVSAMGCLFLKKHTNFLNQTVTINSLVN